MIRIDFLVLGLLATWVENQSRLPTLMIIFRALAINYLCRIHSTYKIAALRNADVDVDTFEACNAYAVQHWPMNTEIIYSHDFSFRLADN